MGSRRIRPAARRGLHRDRGLRPARPDQGPDAETARERAPPSGSPTTCAARPRCCWPDPTTKPPTSPAAPRPGSSRPATSPPADTRRRYRSPTGTCPPRRPLRARLNAEIDAAGRKLTNRDTLKITAIRGTDVEVRRERLDGTWTERFWVPSAYLAASAELGYAGNVHVAQGRTVDTAHLLVTDTLSRQSLYVGMTRGREANTAHVVTGQTAPGGHEPYQQATPEAVIKNVIERDAEDLSATEAIRQSQDWASGTGHLLNLWSAAARPAMHADIDQQITGRLTEHEAQRYQREHSRKALHAALRQAQLAGHDIHAIIDQITQGSMDGARSIASVLHGRLQRLHLPDPGIAATWAQRTPASAPPVAHQLASGLDHHTRELGQRHTADPQPWLTRHLGILPAGASPALAADYTGRAGLAAAYRENAGITNPEQAVSPEPHHGNPELEHQRQETIRALEIADEAAMWAGMDRGELEAHQAAAERAQATAPPDVASQLRATAQAEADARQQAADAQIRNDQTQAASASALADDLAGRRQQLEADDTTYEAWASPTRGARESGNKAAAELHRRGHAQPQPEQQAQPGTGPQTMSDWWRQFETDADALERSIERQHQAAIESGQPWPPRPQPEPEPGTESPASPDWWRQFETDAAAWSAPSSVSARPPPTPASHGHPNAIPRQVQVPKVGPRRSSCARNRPTPTCVYPTRSPALKTRRGGSAPSKPTVTPVASTPRASAGKPKPSPKRTPPRTPRLPPTSRWSCERFRTWPVGTAIARSRVRNDAAAIRLRTRLSSQVSTSAVACALLPDATMRRHAAV